VCRKIVFLLSAAWASAVFSQGREGRIPLTVRERSGTVRFAEPVTFGIPFPEGELEDVHSLRLFLGGREVPAQFRPVGLWRPSCYVKWVLVDFQADLAAWERKIFTVKYGGAATRKRPTSPVRVSETEEFFTVDTGPLIFRISKKRFTLFEEVRAKGGLVFVRPGSAEAGHSGVLLKGLQATVTRVIPGPGNKGRAHLIYAKNVSGGGPEDYTVEFLTHLQFVVKGAKSGNLGCGFFRKNFTSRDGAVSIPSDAWLAYHRPAPGDKFFFRTIPGGSDLSSEGVFDAAVVERGPMRSVIRVKGSFGSTRSPGMEFTAWYHFFAGSSRVKLEFTLENNKHGGRTETGNARNADIGGVNCVFFEEALLCLPLSLEGHLRFRLQGDRSREPLEGILTESIELYQDSSGGEHWDRYRAAEYHPRPNSYVTFRGYRVYRGGREAARGDRAVGCLEIWNRKGTVGIALRDFWQNFPKSVRARKNRSVEIGLFPGRYAAQFPFRSGEHKTHTLLFVFEARPREKTRRLVFPALLSFSDPLRAEPPVKWICRSRAMGYLHPFDMTRYRAYEIRNLSTIGVFPRGETPGMSLVRRVEEENFYGWQDYGDVPIDFESRSGQWGMKYDFDFQMALQYARTGRDEWWRLFEAAARHTADIDIHHQPHYPGLHFVKGGVWAHSLHNEPGNKNPHRNYNHFTKDLAFGARGTAALWYMTGYHKAREACLEIAENALARYMSPQKDPGPPEANNRMGVRGDACTLNRLLEGYLLSGEEKYLQHARWQVRSCAFNGRPSKHPPVSLWSSVFYMCALIRYVEMFPAEEAPRRYLLSHLETLRRSVRPAEGMYYTITPQPDGTVIGKGTCSHYNIMAADTLAYGYLLNADMRFMEAARLCFEYGVKNACWKGGPPTYFQVHSANGATHGNLFMTVDSEPCRRGK